MCTNNYSNKERFGSYYKNKMVQFFGLTVYIALSRSMYFDILNRLGLDQS